MFSQLPTAVFAADGVPTGLVRAGEPRLRRSQRVEAAAAAERVPARSLASLMSRLLHPAAS